MASWNQISTYKHAIESQTAIIVVWCVSDVTKRAEYLDIKITFEDAKKILLQLERNYKPEDGITLTHIDHMLQTIRRGLWDRYK